MKVYIDVLNIMACFAVIVLHCTGKAWEVDGSASWQFAIILQGLFIWAVTIFFMLTGAKCLNYRERYSTITFLKKHVVKIIAVLLLSSVFYLFFFHFTGRVCYESAGDAVRAVINNEVVSIFWFFNKLIPLYISIPIVSLLNDRMRIYYFVLTIIVTYILPWIDRLFEINLAGYTLHFVNPVIALAIWGWILDTREIKKGMRIGIYLTGCFCMAYNIIQTIKISLPQKEYLKDYINSTSLTTILIAAALWTAVQYFVNHHQRVLSERLVHFIHTASSCCFGVYIIQMIVLELVNKIKIIDTYSPYYSVFGSIVIFLACISVVYIGKRVLLICRNELIEQKRRG